ncbi:hypothetical protein GOBAR_AA23442 [Gossypium barbadense]|uniref:UDP-glycosyltransferases domain-containing protein n=1 Tax=Gossypium barbadense TaxID=3634 RepID=A0A2P5X1L2_GOSBA|nr:hypothetical protein GOBAR_AA23442 [Gossypium barbadense]
MGSLFDQPQPHFVLFPFMAQGHLIPMVDIGRLLAQRNVIVTIVTTPHNASRVQNTIARAIESRLRIHLVQLQFPGKEEGLQDGVENLETRHAILETITSDSEYFTVPSLTEKIEFTKAQLSFNRDASRKDIFEPMIQADRASYGVFINTFEELEPTYVKDHKYELDKAKRGNKASTNQQQCLKWLDSQQPNSVIYACLGSISTVKCPELIELGLGLEASNKPFIWMLRGNDTISNQVEKWIKEDGFEERIKGRELVVVGWAP